MDGLRTSVCKIEFAQKALSLGKCPDDFGTMPDKLRKQRAEVRLTCHQHLRTPCPSPHICYQMVSGTNCITIVGYTPRVSDDWVSKPNRHQSSTAGGGHHDATH
jgi:hypothetical protein